MITVRFPTGISITYNAAKLLTYHDQAWVLYTADPAKGGVWVASIQPSAGCIVEWTQPCKIENPAQGLTHDRALEIVANHIRDFQNHGSQHKLAQLKRELADFNARERRWKP